jgi:16S rRNA (guanine(527)-N(7))-methyltransferase RsmG
VKDSKTVELEDILRKTVRADGALFTVHETSCLSRYFDLVLKWNMRLHLTTLTSPGEFVERHICEADFAAEKILDSISEVWDLGTGLGIPGIPMAIFRPDLEVKLVESNRAKSIFLEEVVYDLRLANVEVVRRRIESLEDIPEAVCLTVRAVERMERALADVLRIGAGCGQILVFGNQETDSVVRSLFGREGKIESSLMPGSERRLLIEFTRFT